MYCNTVHNWRTYKSKYTEDVLRSLGKEDAGETLYVDTRWVVLYATPNEKIPVERVQDCLQALNTVYGGRNTDDLVKVPDSSLTPWKQVIGVPNIQFLPLDASTLKVEYRQIPTDLDGTNPVGDAALKGDRVPGVLNIYISSSGKGSILGQAEISGNVVYALYSTVGGFNVHGTLQGYDLGKTVAHEVGHALGLVHTFADNVCDHYSPYSDVPEQVRPNFTTALQETSPGEWTQTGDNRYNDRRNGTTLSCLHIQPDQSIAPNEMGVNIMDYGDDHVSLMFTKNQVSLMRDYLLSPGNTTITLKSKDDISVSSMTDKSSSDASSEDVVFPTTSPTDSGLSTTGIVLICVFSALAFLILIFIIVYYYRKPSTGSSSIRKSEAYASSSNLVTIL